MCDILYDVVNFFRNSQISMSIIFLAFIAFSPLKVLVMENKKISQIDHFSGNDIAKNSLSLCRASHRVASRP